MAEMNFDEFDSGYAVPSRGNAGRWVNLFGAACSVALVIGVAVWGYKLAVRDVAGIPVVRAVEGPLRISPDNPGGEVALHQGLSVNAVASSGTVAPLPDTLILAPQDVDLAADDAPGLAVLSTIENAAPATADGMAVSSLSDSPVTARPVEVATMPTEEMPNDLAVTEVLPATQEEAVAAALAAALSDDGETATANATAAVAPSVEGAAVAASPRPKARPTNVAATVQNTDGSEVSPDAAAPDAAVAATSVAEIDPGTITPGTRLVQLGAFDDTEGARAEWQRLSSQFPELLATKSMVIQTAISGGRTFYRLRAYGYENEDDSRRFCAAFLAENASCIPVTQR